MCGGVGVGGSGWLKKNELCWALPVSKKKIKIIPMNMLSLFWSGKKKGGGGHKWFLTV